MNASALGTAPADRARGRRGPRGALALVATVAGLGLLMMRFETTGGGGDGRGTFDYWLNGPVWADPALLILGLGLGAIAMALWAAAGERRWARPSCCCRW